MKQILFPTNLTETSKTALNTAKSIALQSGRRLRLLHTYYSNYSTKRPLINQGTIYEEAFRKLKSFAKNQMIFQDPEMIYQVAKGSPAEQIIEASKKKTCDLIIMNRSHSYEWTDWVFGTTITAVSLQSQAPLLILPTEYSLKDFNKIYINTSLDIKPIISKYDSIFGGKEHIYDRYNSDLFLITKKNKTNIKAKRRRKYRPAKYLERKQNLLSKVKKTQSDLLIIVLEEHKWISKKMEQLFFLPIILELDIPVMVINQNTLKNMELNTGVKHQVIQKLERVAS